MNMTKIVKTNHPNEIITLELSKSELEDILNSVDCMTEKEQRKLLENIPSTEEGRTRWTNTKPLRKISKYLIRFVKLNTIEIRNYMLYCQMKEL